MEGSERGTADESVMVRAAGLNTLWFYRPTQQHQSNSLTFLLGDETIGPQASKMVSKGIRFPFIPLPGDAAP